MRPQALALHYLLERRLNAYVLAASAAGVSVLALAPPSEAKIVYTRAHKQIRISQEILLDLNHDGIVDFGVHLTGRASRRGGYYLRTLTVAPPAETKGTNAMWGVESKHVWCAAALSTGVKIGGPSRPLQQRALVMLRTSTAGTALCQWENQPTANLGLRFTIAGKSHYGWARFSTDAGIFLTGYAYETIPNRPIIAGKTKGTGVITVQPASLGHLAAGFSAMPGEMVDLKLPQSNTRN
jgi:hypothetical protein